MAFERSVDLINARNFFGRKRGWVSRIERNPPLNKKRTRLFPISRNRWYFRVPTFVLLDLWYPDYPQFSNLEHRTIILPNLEDWLFQRKIQWKCIFRRVKKSSKFTVNSRFSAYSATFESFILKYNYIRTSKWLFRSVQLRWFVETLLRYQRHILSVLCRDQNREQHTGHPSFVRTRNEPATFTSELPRVV